MLVHTQAPAEYLRSALIKGDTSALRWYSWELNRKTFSSKSVEKAVLLTNLRYRDLSVQGFLFIDVKSSSQGKVFRVWCRGWENLLILIWGYIWSFPRTFSNSVHRQVFFFLWTHLVRFSRRICAKLSLFDHTLLSLFLYLPTLVIFICRELESLVGICETVLVGTSSGQGQIRAATWLLSPRIMALSRKFDAVDGHGGLSSTSRE
jgi:hypothetical protein